MPKITRKHITAALAILIILFAFAFFRYRSAVHSALDPDNTEEISISIKPGDSISHIADTLEEKDIIKSSSAFYWYTRIHGLDTSIISGRFMLSSSMTVPEILTKIGNPAESEAIITIQEGLRIADIDERLTEMNLIQKGEFTKAVQAFDDYDSYDFISKIFLKETSNLAIPLEGYLYPDTYFLDPIEFDPTNLIYKTLDNFENKISTLTGTIEASPRSFHEVITMASILEKEVRTSEDRRLVAGILWKRLDSEWRLDADATLLYEKTDTKITTKDLNSDSPYNTRKLKGLPPGPICNPSIESIEAVLNPTASSHWFYLTTKDGTTIFADTNEQHEQNKTKYLN